MLALAAAQALSLTLKLPLDSLQVFDVAPSGPESIFVLAGIGLVFLWLIIVLVAGIVTVAVILIRRSIRKNKERNGGGN